MEYNRVVVTKKGGPEVLFWETDKLEPNEQNGVLIEVWSIGIGFVDIMAQRGGYGLAPKIPFSPGYELVGRVLNPGKSKFFKVNDLVAALLPEMGAYRELIEIEENYLVKLPEHINLLKATASILNYLTAYCILEKKTNLSEKDSVFIQRVSGGVGIALVQVGRLKNLSMYGTASKHNRGFVEELGVTHIDYTKKDFSEILNKHSGGIEAAFDSRGGRDLIKAANVVKKNGIIVSYGFSGNDYGGTLETVKGIWSLLRIAPQKEKRQDLWTTVGSKKEPPMV